jgi:hypothetical protein
MGFGFSAFTQFHVAVSLIGIAAGFVVAYGLVVGRRLPAWNAVFLAFTVGTSVTGFFFPIEKFTPALAFGVVSLIALAVAVRARYGAGGTQPKTYAATALFAQYLNVFVLVAQLFQKVPALHDLAPTQSEPPFGVAQGVVFVAFVAIAVAAIRRHPAGAVDQLPVPTARVEPARSLSHN